MSGDHGGASPEEVNALFFAYSTVPFIDEADLQSMWVSPQRVPTESFFGTDRLSGITAPSFLQTDFVPTLSVLLGLPIPSGSLGSVVPFLFPTFMMGAAQDSARVAAALQSNCAQLHDFLVAYQKETSGSLPAGDVERILGIYRCGRSLKRAPVAPGPASQIPARITALPASLAKSLPTGRVSGASPTLLPLP